jgi:hypothetical protein
VFVGFVQGEGDTCFIGSHRQKPLECEIIMLLFVSATEEKALLLMWWVEHLDLHTYIYIYIYI